MEKSFVDGLVEGRILEDVAEEGINKSEGLEKRHGVVTPSVVVGVAEAVIAEAVVTEEDVAENENSENLVEHDVDRVDGRIDQDSADEIVGDASTSDRFVGGDGVNAGDGFVEPGNVAEWDAGSGGIDKEAAESIKKDVVGEGCVREKGIVEGVITDGSSAQGITEKGVAQDMEEWDVREGAAE